MQSLKSLTRLDLQGNQLQCLPVELLTLLSLNTLNISRNCVGPQLTFHPAATCPSLRHLNLSFNKIATFPRELSRAGSQLEELCLEGSVFSPVRNEVWTSVPVRCGRTVASLRDSTSLN